jgi:hypothetical protein
MVAALTAALPRPQVVLVAPGTAAAPPLKPVTAAMALVAPAATAAASALAMCPASAPPSRSAMAVMAVLAARALAGSAGLPPVLLVVMGSVELAVALAPAAELLLAVLAALLALRPDVTARLAGG